MNDDPLKRMATALAEENDGAHAAPQVTRARVQRLLAEKQKKRRSWLVFGVPLFAVFAGSTAWAALHDGLPSVDALFSFTEATDSKSDASLSPTASSAATASTDTTPTLVPSEPSNAAPSSAGPSSAAPSVATPTTTVSSPSSTASAPASVAPPVARNPSISAASAPQTPTAPPVDPSTLGLEIYKRAHALQFHESNCADAISSYVEYLRVAPRGAFVLEARYNTGVCAARIGRNDDARRSLQPFADGSLGDYRSADARALLDALDSHAE